MGNHATLRSPLAEPGDAGALVDLEAPSGVCSNEAGNGDLEEMIGYGSASPCLVGDQVFVQSGTIASLLSDGMSARLSREGDCDSVYGDGNGADDWWEVLEMTNGTTPPDPAASLQQREGCLSPRLVNMIIVQELALSNEPMLLVEFLRLFILGCKSQEGDFDGSCELPPSEVTTIVGMLVDVDIADDADRDGMTDEFELAYACLDARIPDAPSDADGDALLNVEEGVTSTSPCDSDSDDDRCGDGEELGPDHRFGGQREPTDAWDFYDVNASSKVDSVDIAIVRSKFTGPGATPVEDRPYDRSAGSQPWAPSTPDGFINAVDVGLVRASFNDNCQAPP